MVRRGPYNQIFNQTALSLERTNYKNIFNVLILLKLSILCAYWKIIMQKYKAEDFLAFYSCLRLVFL